MTTMNIHTVNKHLNMRANKLNAKYHLHVQHSTDVRIIKHEVLGLNCIKNTRSNKGTSILKKIQDIN